jgi:hypothetical protein
MKTRNIKLPILIALFGAAISSGGADRFAGHFTSADLSWEAKGDHGSYTGTIKKGDSTFEFTADEKPDGLAGSFTTPDGEFDFRATIKDNTLTLSTGEKQYKLKKFNPLDTPKSSDGTGKQVTDAVRKEGSTFFGNFLKGIADSKGNVKGSATTAGFGAIGSIGANEFGADPTETQAAGGSQPGEPAPGAGSLTAPKASHDKALAGIWVKTEKTVVDGSTGTKLTFMVFRTDGSMLITPNQQTAHNFTKGKPSAISHAADKPNPSSADVYAHWSCNNSMLTMTYDGGNTDRDSYEISSGAGNLRVLHIQGPDGSPAQEWAKSNN